MTDLIYIDQVFKSIRTDYQSGTLEETDLNPDPLKQFYQWLEFAYQWGSPEANAFTLATSDKDLNLNQRVVLLKALSETSLLFFTNYNSQKAKEIEENQKVSCLFFWPKLERQVRIQGNIKKTTKEISSEYFAMRPRKSQLAAMISDQSEVVLSRKELQEKYQAIESETKDKDLKCPDFWGGYEITPSYFEFWQGRGSRLHDRLVYTDAPNWQIKRLSP